MASVDITEAAASATKAGARGGASSWEDASLLETFARKRAFTRATWRGTRRARPARDSKRAGAIPRRGARTASEATDMIIPRIDREERARRLGNCESRAETSAVTSSSRSRRTSRRCPFREEARKEHFCAFGFARSRTLHTRPAPRYAHPPRPPPSPPCLTPRCDGTHRFFVTGRGASRASSRASRTWRSRRASSRWSGARSASACAATSRRRRSLAC